LITPITATFPALNFPKEVDYPTQEDWAAFSAAAELNYGILSGTWSDKSEEFKAQTNNLALEIQEMGENAFNAISIDNIEDLETYTGTGLVMVKDINSGGTFVSKTAIEIDPNTGSLYSVNDGTVFAKLGGGFWARQYTGSVNVKWFGAKGDGINDDTLAIQKALDLGRAVVAPAGVFLVDNISIQQHGAVLKGHGHGKTIFKAIDSKTSGAIISLATTSRADRCIFSDFSIEGRVNENTASPLTSILGLEIGSSISIVSSRSSFENIYISKCHIGLSIIYSWTNSFRHIQTEQCFLGMKLNSQANNIDFTKYIAVNCRKHLEISNCEGVSFETPLFQNTSLLAGEGYAISLFQSNVTMNNPYFEGTAPDGLAIVGNSAESINTPSSLIITGGELNGENGNILKHQFASVNVTNLREPVGTAVVIGGECAFNTTSTESRGGVKSNSSLKRLTASNIEQNKLLYSLPIDNSEFLVKTGGGGGALTTAPNPDNSMVASVDVANRGLLLPSPVLEIGKIYTLAYRIKTTSEIILSVGKNIIIPVNASTFETLYVTFMANAAVQTGLIFATTTPVNIQQLDLYEGCVIGTDNGYQDSLKKYGSVAPATGTWKLNQVVYAKSPTASGFIGWVCTVAGTPGTWKTFGAISA